jgi:predicted Rossmann fold nucleotide-binding protein DprA/Smf involved in DNA uptake
MADPQTFAEISITEKYVDTSNTLADKEIHMPIDIETFESSPADRLQNSRETNADRVMRFLAAHTNKAFTQSEIRDATDIKAGSISVVLSRLENRGLVRHKGNYWALGEDDDVAAYTSMLESTRAANDRFGEEDMDEWLEHAADDDETE